MTQLPSVHGQRKLLHVVTAAVSLRFFTGQPQFMRDRGLIVEVMSSPGRELADFTARERVAGHAVSMRRRISPFADLSSLVRIIRVIRRVNPDIVHSHTPKAGLLAMLAAAFARTPVRLYHLHGLRYSESRGTTRTLLKAMEWLSCSLAHRVFCVSHSIREQAIQDGVCRADKVSVFASGSIQGVDANGRFNPANVPPQMRDEVRAQLGIPSGIALVGFVGRVVRDKGIIELIEAWKDFQASGARAELLVVGPFESEDPIPEAVHAYLHAEPTIHLVGMTEDIPALYSAMDMVILPTYREGFPLVPLEAAAMQLPVVATRVPGCTDAIQDGVTGMLVPPRDAGALLYAIRRYVDDPTLRARHGEAGRDRVLREFRPEVVWGEMYRAYTECLSGHRLVRQKDAYKIKASGPTRR